jgi:hypothetical protein
MRRPNREQLRRTHRPAGPERRCAACGESWTCTTILLLVDIEALETVARQKAEEAAGLQRNVLRLEEKVRRAIRELTS